MAVWLACKVRMVEKVKKYPAGDLDPFGASAFQPLGYF
jgi:hypothetical protein